MSRGVVFLLLICSPCLRLVDLKVSSPDSKCEKWRSTLEFIVAARQTVAKCLNFILVGDDFKVWMPAWATNDLTVGCFVHEPRSKESGYS